MTAWTVLGVVGACILIPFLLVWMFSNLLKLFGRDEL